jgi:predicted transcriptional regulator
MSNEFNITKPEKNYTKISEDIYSYIKNKSISITDLTTYIGIKTQIEGGYDSSVRSVARVFSIDKNKVSRSFKALEDCGLLFIDRSGGRFSCKLKDIGGEEFDKIPKALLMTSEIDIKQKAFLISSWAFIEDNKYYGSRRSLYEEAFKTLNVSLSWVTQRINSLINKGILSKGNETFCFEINLESIVEISDLIIDNNLEIINEYEVKTGVSRDEVFAWEPTKETVEKTESESPKWLTPITEAISEGNNILGRGDFKFTSSDFREIAKNVRQVIDEAGDDKVVEDIVNSIKWKAERALNNDKEKKYWSKGFFVRKTKNNFSTNLYHYKKFLAENPFYNKFKTPKIKKSNKSDSKPQENYSGKRRSEAMKILYGED